MLQRIWAITQKEFIQALRDRVTLIVIPLGVVVEVILLATAIHTDIKHIPMVVADQSMSSTSRSYLNALVHSEYFTLIATVSGQADLIKAIDSGQASLGILIPPNFATQVRLRQAKVLLLVDGSDSFTARSAYSMVSAISQAYAIRLLRQPVTPVNMIIHILYNPEAKELWFVIPGLIASMLQGVIINLTTMAVVREREVGTIEALLVTPIQPIEMMLGKTIPNLVIALVVTSLVLAESTLVFGAPFLGNPLLFLIVATLFAVSSLGLGLAISTIVQNQVQAQLLSTMFNFVAMFLGGFLFPAYALPAALRLISYIFPISYFLPTVRAILVKGVGIAAIWGEVAAISALMVLILWGAARLFHQSLD
jgi:ABC-2 type transport system permease protein